MEPVSGLDVMRDRRKTSDSRALLNGPGKICQAFGIDKCLNGLDLKSNGKAITLTAYEPCQNISLTNRVGVTTNKSAKLRFVDTQSDCLSRKV